MHNHPDNRGVAEQSPQNQPQNSSKIVPPGIYQAILVEAEFRKSSHGTPGWHAKVEIIDGPHAGRRFWADYWLSKPAKPVSKDRLARIGLHSIEDLKNAPLGAKYLVRVSSRVGRNGQLYSEVDLVKLLPAPEYVGDTTPSQSDQDDQEHGCGHGGRAPEEDYDDFGGYGGYDASDDSDESVCAPLSEEESDCSDLFEF